MDKIKILLVEDEPSLTDMYRVAFRDSQFDMYCTHDAKSAWDYAVNNKPAIILLDIIIPKENGSVVEFSKRVGFDLLADLKKNKAAKKIPVLILTNLDSPEDRDKAQKLGALDYVIKANFLPKEVVEKVRNTLKTKKSV